jgi:precorrin-2 dehydrogenase / sirohydrochlorin ferrochelatase
MTKLFPIFLNLKNKNVLVYGNDKHSTDRVEQLLKTGANVRLINPDLQQVELSNSRWLKVVERKLVKSDFIDLDIAFVDQSLTEKEFSWLSKSNVLFHQLDELEKTDFYLGSIVDYGPTRIAISSNGQFPWLPKFLRELLEDIFLENGEELLTQIGTIRSKIKEKFPITRERRLNISRLNKQLDAIFRQNKFEIKEPN